MHFVATCERVCIQAESECGFSHDSTEIPPAPCPV